MTDLSNLNQNDPRYPIILDHARDMVSKRFEMIPACLFESLYQANPDEPPLELVGSNMHECPECGEEIEAGREVVCECGAADPDDKLDVCICDIDPDDHEGEHHWECESCNCSSEVTEDTYENTPLAGPRYGAWPAAHGYVFWTTDWQSPNQFTPGIVAAGEESGFLVYEPTEFNGHVLAVDGGGYDFYEAHWVPLYLALGLRWHEQDERWQSACIEKRKHMRQELNTDESKRERMRERMKPYGLTPEMLVCDMTKEQVEAYRQYKRDHAEE